MSSAALLAVVTSGNDVALLEAAKFCDDDFFTTRLATY